ncbi:MULTISPECIES: TauD/TfdA dioxygenase family protein [Pandoraea]|uniref:Taurine catabolism dioxygenase TauD n=1 Tax=Pandoraea soli TaxID=2508293 RepID=A0ABY6VVB2_9BURK|nr:MULTISPECIES: TauD/TfdA family dioxygenase [Pandoraea]ANC45102.1 taurine catabolism dioxygenase TauD [Pandoraea pnomenusa]VVD85530.1 taurine catabolism dioxygenase TauD [Pandoraea soli]
MKFTVTPLVEDFVAEIPDFPFESLDDETIEQFRSVWKQYPLIRFRNVKIDDATQVAFSKRLGPPVIHPRQLQQGKNAEFPEILVISNKKKVDGTAAGDLGDGEVNWHTDTWFVERPPSAAILRSIEIPPEGGNTYFANMYSAYAALPEALKQRLKGLEIHHQNVIDGRGEVRLNKTKPDNEDYATWSGVDHPIVRLHGDSKKPCIYLGGEPHRQAIVGMPQAEAKELLADLWERATDKHHVWIQQWQPGDMMMWDNRCLMHYRDSFDPATTRLMHRTTVEGERPVAA